MTFKKVWSWTNSAPEPLRDALRLFCGGKEPPEYVQGYDYSNLTDDQHQHLQDWVNMNPSGGHLLEHRHRRNRGSPEPSRRG